MEIELIYCQFMERKCSSDLEKMENNTSNSVSSEKKPSLGSILASEETRPTEKASTFVNHAEITWHKQRREWTGDINQRAPKVAKDPVISWSMTYEDLLMTGEPFPQSIPLSEMVDFLVDIWNDEGLYD
ncbi:hypothetical protein Syun_016321 [Stephania yunnanensis]|uniref:Gag1-like clamp domain-containing protein n=1 Tax=Stephania yunnanensis TaxID=152371 RepID=A0AAP0P2C1_9MAGN